MLSDPPESRLARVDDLRARRPDLREAGPVLRSAIWRLRVGQRLLAEFAISSADRCDREFIHGCAEAWARRIRRLQSRADHELGIDPVAENLTGSGLRLPRLLSALRMDSWGPHQEDASRARELDRSLWVIHSLAVACFSSASTGEAGRSSA